MITRNELLTKYKQVITDYIDVNDHIEILVNLPEKSIVVTKNEFWKWMVSKGYNEYCYDYNDPSQFDGHGQKSGKITKDEYFQNTDTKERMVDLYEFLVESNRIDFLVKF